MTCELCGESLPLHDVFNHVRVMHPDQWDEQLPNAPVEVHLNVSSPVGTASLVNAIRVHWRHR